VPGEIWIGGAGVGLGYWNQPRLTAERFVPDPFAARPGARLYRTGDRGRWRDDGQLEFLGRADRQMKIRGHRIEPEEVEATLRRKERIGDAAVDMVEDTEGRARLVAYIELRNSDSEDAHSVTREALRAFVSTRLPEFMVPSSFVLVEAIPRTAGGKLDRASLPSLASDVGSGQGDASPPRSAAERIIARIWQDLLGTARIGVEDNFFALGGDSILSIQVVARARQRGLHITTRQ